MEAIDELGIFWLPNFENDTLTGRLVFTPGKNGIRLSLIGSFENYSAHDEPGNAGMRMLGWIGHDKVTLNRGFFTGPHQKHLGSELTAFYANEMFVGEHIDDEMSFDSVAVKLDHLGSWVGHAGIEQESIGSTHTIKFSPPPEEVSRFSRGEISLGYSWKTGGGSIETASINSRPYLRIRYDHRHTFSKIQKDIGHLESLISMCVGAPAEVDEVTLFRSDVTITMMSGENSGILQSIRYIHNHLNHTPSAERKMLHYYQLLLSYKELGAVSTISTWLDKAATFQRALGSLISITRRKEMFAENKFMNVIYAAEALHRQILGQGRQMDQEIFDALITTYSEHTPHEHQKWLFSRLSHANEPTLVKRLSELASSVPEASKALVGDRNRWAQTITAMRNDLTHLASADEGPSGSYLYYLTESVFSIMKIFLLLNVGVSSDTLVTKVRDSEIIQYREGIISSISEARAYLRTADRL